MNSEKPIIFSTPMVQAILARRKTQTRLVIKQPRCESAVSVDILSKTGWSNEHGYPVKAYANPGDILWVRETWTLMEPKNNEGPPFYLYKADEPDCESSPWFSKWRSSMFMPRAAARIFLRVTDVRVERVQEISEEDAKSEGFTDEMCAYKKNDRSSCTVCISGDCIQYDASLKFKDTWDSLNAKRGFSWESNPFVWVISFERVEK